VADDLAEHIRRYSNPDDPKALVFPTRNGTMLGRDDFRHIFQRAAAKVNVNHGYSPNDMRHTAAAFAIQHGANVYGVQRMLGHAKPSITLNVYGFLWDKSMDQLAETLDEAIRAEK
jgi:site-specific recombinase XerD